MLMWNWSLYVITDATLAGGRTHLEVIRAAIAGGATIVQYARSTPRRAA